MYGYFAARLDLECAHKVANYGAIASMVFLTTSFPSDHVWRVNAGNLSGLNILVEPEEKETHCNSS